VEKPPALPQGAAADLVALAGRAKAGEVEAQVDLADHFVSGIRPDPADVRRALFWYEQAAERGDADAAWALAALYRNRNELVPQARADLPAAVDWYRRAAEGGHAEAMYDLGLLYAQGEGVDADPVQAVQWFEAAADAGVARALFMLGILYEQGVDGAPDLETAAGWYGRAAAAGDATGEEALKRLAAGQGNVQVADLPLSPPAAAGATAGAGATADRPARTADSAARTTNQAKAQPRALPINQAGVREIQRLLGRLGYRPGKADGHLGKRTISAIRAYQKAEKLPVDGRATQPLLDHLRRRAGA
jgi:hypothetical protein